MKFSTGIKKFWQAWSLLDGVFNLLPLAQVAIQAVALQICLGILALTGLAADKSFNLNFKLYPFTLTDLQALRSTLESIDLKLLLIVALLFVGAVSIYTFFNAAIMQLTLHLTEQKRSLSRALSNCFQAVVQAVAFEVVVVPCFVLRLARL